MKIIRAMSSRKRKTQTEWAALKIGAVSCCAAVVSGCATIVSDDKYSVEIASSVSGADFSIFDASSGERVVSGKTPQVVELDSGSGYFSRAEYSVVVEKHGYGKNQKTLRAELDPWYLANLMLSAPGWIGFLVVDPLTGAMWKLPDSVFVALSSQDETKDFSESENKGKVKYSSPYVKHASPAVRYSAPCP